MNRNGREGHQMPILVQVAGRLHLDALGLDEDDS